MTSKLVKLFTNLVRPERARQLEEASTRQSTGAGTRWLRVHSQLRLHRQPLAYLEVMLCDRSERIDCLGNRVEVSRELFMDVVVMVRIV